MNEKYTIDDLIRKDKLVNERKSLKDLILEMEDEVLANAGVDVFEELFKLIFTKLYDEMESGRNKKRYLVFRNSGDTEIELKIKFKIYLKKPEKNGKAYFPKTAKSSLLLRICLSVFLHCKMLSCLIPIWMWWMKLLNT